MAAARSGVRSPWEAKPQTPSTSTRTASPTTVSSATPVTAPSRSEIVWVMMRSTRMSACWAPRSRARVERGVGEGGERQRAELRVDPVEHGFNLERDPDARPPAPIKGDAPHPSPRSHDGESRLSSRRVAHFIAAAAASNCRGSGCAAVWADSADGADGADRGGRIRTSGRGVRIEAGRIGARRGGYVRSSSRSMRMTPSGPSRRIWSTMPSASRSVPKIRSTPSSTRLVSSSPSPSVSRMSGAASRSGTSRGSCTGHRPRPGEREQLGLDDRAAALHRGVELGRRRTFELQQHALDVDAQGDAGLPEHRIHLTAQQGLLGAAPARDHRDRHRGGTEPDGDRRQRGPAPDRQPDQRHGRQHHERDPPDREPLGRAREPRRAHPISGLTGQQRQPGRREGGPSGAEVEPPDRGDAAQRGRQLGEGGRVDPRGQPVERGRQTGGQRATDGPLGVAGVRRDIPAEIGERRRGPIGGDDARQPQLGAQLGAVGARERRQLGAQLRPTGPHSIGVAIRHRHRLLPAFRPRLCRPRRSSEAGAGKRFAGANGDHPDGGCSASATSRA